MDTENEGDDRAARREEVCAVQRGSVVGLAARPPAGKRETNPGSGQRAPERKSGKGVGERAARVQRGGVGRGNGWTSPGLAISAAFIACVARRVGGGGGGRVRRHGGETRWRSGRRHLESLG